jgi:hypothetical protein
VPAVRFVLALTAGELAWIIVAGFAVVGFSRQVTWPRYEIVHAEVFCFASAFAVAGTITGTVASAASGRRRWAMGICAVNAVLLGTSLVILRRFIFGATAPNVMWGKSCWDLAIECVMVGSAVGLAFAFVVSAAILAVTALERHLKAWQFGLVVAAAVGLLGWSLLPVALVALADSSANLIDFLKSYCGIVHTYRDSLQGAGAGAGAGAFAGAIVAGLMARWCCARQNVRAHLRTDESTVPR